MGRAKKEFAPEYKEKVYLVWYEKDRPSATKLQEMIEPDGEGDKPSVSVLSDWIVQEFEPRADIIHVEAVAQHNDLLLKEQQEFLEKLQQDGKKLQFLAMQYFEENGVTSGNVALKALKLGLDMEQAALGMKELIDKLSNMSNEALEREIARLVSDVEDAETLEIQSAEIVDD